jgi:hypothetical protein
LLIGLPTGAVAARPPSPVELGRQLFTRNWEPSHADAKHGDGLGPLFNARSCAACHNQAGIGGGGPLESNVQLVTLSPVPAGSPWKFTEAAQREFLFPTAESNSIVLHRFGTSAAYATWRAAVLRFAAPASSQDAELFQAERQLDLFRRGLTVTTTNSPSPPPSVLQLMTVRLEERNTPSYSGRA